MIRFGSEDMRLVLLDAGTLWLDGGAMFGVVPKPLWSRRRAPDEQNRIRLAMNVLLIDDGSRRILIDTGAGVDWDDKQRAIYRIESRGAAELLAPAGLTPDGIDLVINSHLHFDHAGGNTVTDDTGRVVPAFPNARHVVQRGELATARLQNERTRASYRARDFEPLAEQDRLWVVDGETTITPRVTVTPAPGHTPHMQMVLVDCGSVQTAFLADLVPTTSHVSYPYIMGYDLEPLVTLESKKRILPLAARDHWWLVFEHDADIPLACLQEDDGRLVVRPLQVEA